MNIYNKQFVHKFIYLKFLDTLYICYMHLLSLNIYTSAFCQQIWYFLLQLFQNL